MAENLIKLKLNKKLLEQKLSVKSGKIVTQKGIKQFSNENKCCRETMIYKAKLIPFKTNMISSKKSTFVNFKIYFLS